MTPSKWVTKHKWISTKNQMKRIVVTVIWLALCLQAGVAPAVDVRAISPHTLMPAALTDPATPWPDGERSVVRLHAYDNPQITLYYDYKPIDAANIQQVYEAIDDLALGGKENRWLGMTEWDVTWFYDTVKTSSYCSVVRPRVVFVAIMTLPTWKTPWRAAAQDIAAWNKGAMETFRHENIHKQHGVMAAKAVLEALRHTPDYATCEELKKYVEWAAGSRVWQYQAWDDAFDDLAHAEMGDDLEQRWDRQARPPAQGAKEQARRHAQSPHQEPEPGGSPSGRASPVAPLNGGEHDRICY